VDFRGHLAGILCCRAHNTNGAAYLIPVLCWWRFSRFRVGELPYGHVQRKESLSSRRRE
jgi:hypothetical protein